MSKQSEVVPEVIRLVAECGVDVGLILGGSVGQGSERAESDVDFFAIADADIPPSLPGFSLVSEKNGCKVLERQQSGFPVHVACWTTASLDEVLRRRPYMTYPLLCGGVVFDAIGIAAQYRTRIREYFGAHPAIERAWGEQLNSLRRSRGSRHEHLRFPQWSDFIRHIEQTFEEEIAKQPPERDK